MSEGIIDQEIRADRKKLIRTGGFMCRLMGIGL